MTAPADISAAARHFAAADYLAAEFACRSLLHHYPDHFDALHLLGVVLSRQDRHAEATGYLKQTAIINPDNAQRQSNLCNAAIALKEYVSGMAACEQALRLSPNDPGVLCNLGLIHEALEESQPASII